VFVREVRRGSVIADLIPCLSMVAPIIDDMQKALIVGKFVRVWKVRFESFLFNLSEAPNTRSEVKDLLMR
jgi:hypothetical protein